MNKTLLNSMYRRRVSCPQMVQQLWDAVKVIRCHHQTPTIEKIAKFMSRTHNVSEEEVSRQLQNCVRDGLLHIKKSKVSKGSKLGTEQEGYKLPEPEEVDDKNDSHDWYCFNCHESGDVIPCQGCHRVYHLSCATVGNKDKFICTVCQICEKDNSLPDLKLRKLNRILSFVCTLLKDKYSALNSFNEFLRRPIFIGSTGAQMDISTGKESWRVPFLVHKPIDLGNMMTTAKEKKYQNVSEFVAHAQSLVHNVVVFHGGLSDLADKSRQMLRECRSEISQVLACPSCYETAVLKQNRHWFCKPCRPPHTLVFAGSPYMPAKVLQEKDDKYEVVFFGPDHPRCTVDRDATLPITTAVGHLGKTSAAWSKAMDELARHQKLLTSSNQSSSSDSEESIVESRISKEKERASPIAKVSPIPVSKSPTPKTDRFSSDEEEVKKEVVKRKRGRPPKTSVDSWPLKRSISNTKLSDLYSSDDESVKKEVVKKKRGRPPKNSSATVTPTNTPRVLPRRRPGRPRRKKPDEEMEEDQIEENTPVKKEDTSEAQSETPAEETESKGDETRRPESPTTTVSTASNVKKNEEEIVSSSCMEPQVRCVSTQTTKKEKGNKDYNKLKDELEEIKLSHVEEIKTLKDAHALEVSATKKKQWCYNCEQEAIYHCCWNTAYCSTDCQQVHWQREHKRVCRRKR